jgi:hypothetical protein
MGLGSMKMDAFQGTAGESKTEPPRIPIPEKTKKKGAANSEGRGIGRRE